MPPALPRARWALTPPFHPCLIPRSITLARAIGGLIFCGTVCRTSAFARLRAPRCYLAACPVEPGLSSIDRRAHTRQPIATVRPTVAHLWNEI